MLRAPLFLVMPLLAIFAAGGLPLLTGLLSGPAGTRRAVLSDDWDASVASPEHPLVPVLELARQTRAHVADNVRDYQCTLIKRERIDGQLQSQRMIEMRVREGSPRLASAGQPFSVFLDFLAPGDVMGRRILYREGKDDNKMLVRKGGRRLEFVVLRLDTLGYKAQRRKPGSHYGSRFSSSP